MEMGWTGADVSTSKTAEGAAMLRAVEWCFSASHVCETIFRFDSLTTGLAANGKNAIHPGDRQLRIVRALVLALDAFTHTWRTYQWRHVKGHSGCLGNELADAMARRAFQLQHELRNACRPDYAPYATGHRYGLEFLWIRFAKTTHGARLAGHDCLCLPRVDIGGPVEKRLPKAVYDHRVESTGMKKFDLTMVTYNVQTLSKKAGGMFVQYLRDQAASHQIDVLFLQETRSKKSQLVVSSTHFRYVAAAENGVGGLETWLARSVEGHRRTLFSKEQVQVLKATNQVLLIKVVCTGVPFLLLNFHAPHSGRTLEEIENFWHELVSLLKPLVSVYPHLILGADANAHWSTSCEGYIGEAGLELRSNHGGECFKNFLVDFGLFVPSTYGQYHTGMHHTWFSTVNGQGCRCDYFALPQSWREGKISTMVIDSLDEGKHGVDHMPLMLNVGIFLQGESMPKKSKLFNRSALQKATVEDIEDALKSVQPPDWHTEIDQHAMGLVQQISDALLKAFPPTKDKPRRSYVSDEAWKMRKMRISKRRETVQKRLELNMYTLRDAFWRWLGSKSTEPTDFFIAGLRHMRELVILRRETAALTKKMTYRLRQDRTASLEKLAQEEPYMTPKAFADAMKSIGVRNPKKPSGVQPLPLIVRENGSPAATFQELLDCWRNYFGEQEDGHEVTAEELLQQSDRRWTMCTSQATWDLMPTRYQIERQFRRAKSDKAFFMDLIPGELLHRAPATMAALCYSLFCKQVAFVREPNLFKGGYLVPAFKKGSPQKIENYRSLFISSTLGKALHSIYRGDLVRYFVPRSFNLQVGGVPLQGLTQPVHALRTFQDHAIAQGRSYAILFIDISNAFYRLLRQHLVRLSGDTREVVALFHSLRLPAGSYAEFCQMMEEPPALETDDAPPHLAELSREFLESTWFQMRGDSKLVQTKRGSRPGDSYADLLFSFALEKILKAAVEQVATCFPDILVDWDGHRTPFRSSEPSHQLEPVMPIWADDVAMAFDDRDPDALISKCETIAMIVFDRLRASGLQPNLSPGKSEILVDVRGPGSLRVRRQIHLHDCKLTIPSQVEERQLTVVGAYRHLGTWIQTGGGIAKEIKMRFAMAHDMVTRYRAQIFANRGMTIVRKRQFFESLIMSGILYNAAVWRPRNSRQHGQLESALHNLYKRFAILHFGKRALTWSRAWLLAQVGMPDLRTLLVVARLRYLGQLLCTGKDIIWALLQRDEPWRSQLLEDLRTLGEYCPEQSYLAQMPEAWDDLMHYVTHHPIAWKRCVRKFLARRVASHKLDADWWSWHKQIRDECLKCGLVSSEECEYAANTHYCLCCAMTFAKRSHLAVHAFKKHNRANRARAFVTGTQCEHCLKVFDVHSFLLNHVKRAEACYSFYATRGTRVPREPGVNSRKENAHFSSFRNPFFQAEGPRCPPHELMMYVPDEEVMRLDKEWTAAYSLAHPKDLLDQLRRSTLQTYLYHEEILEAFSNWTERQSQQDSFVLATFQIFEQFRRHASSEWFLTGTVSRSEDVPKVQAFFEKEADALTAIVRPLPRPLRYRPKVFAHLFSGVRREGDFQSYVEALHSMAISIDVIFDLQWGNLLQDSTFQLFSRALAEGVLTGFLSGSPCETWSRARAANDLGPRVLRWRSRPQGRKDLTKRESAQVSLGSLLLGVTFRLFLQALLCGATAIVEHPAEPEDDVTLPSIWRLTVVRFFLRFSNCCKVRILQGRYGGRAPKATDLLLANCGEDPERFFFQERTTALPKGGFIGKTSEGTWRTAILKEYPPDLCKAFAKLFDQQHAFAEDTEALPQWFADAVTKLTADFNEQAGMGPDFCRDAADVQNNSELNATLSQANRHWQ